MATPTSLSRQREAVSIINDAWLELQRSPYVQQQLGTRIERMPDLSFAEADRRSKIGEALLRRIEAVTSEQVPHEIELDLRMVRFRATAWAREADWYWTVSDPLGIMFFGMFLPTGYCGGWLLNVVHGQLNAFEFESSEDTDQYLSLVDQYARLIDQFAERTIGQADRGMLISKEQVHQARKLLLALKAQAPHALAVETERLSGIATAGFREELNWRISTRVGPAFDRSIAILSDRYLGKAPEAVGLRQYRGGEAIYPELVRLHTTLDFMPEEIHEIGKKRLADIEQSMESIRNELGSKVDSKEFLQHLDQDPSWRANSAEAIGNLFRRYMTRLEGCFDRYFPPRPRASYDVAPLPEALQGSMTFGYYDAPRRSRREGIYLFNTENLAKRALVHVGALGYHELMPGHHLHFATQQENDGLHPFRKFSFVNACNEGWAEYAATFVGEIGLYEKPEERYGRLIMDAFLTTRLVVDTGMNWLGWSLERAREYMRVHSGMSEVEVLSESLRYSCDIPGQALAYKLGDTRIRDLRERLRAELGAQFNVKDFHAAVVAAGTLPLPDLEWHLEHALKHGAAEVMT